MAPASNWALLAVLAWALAGPTGFSSSSSVPDWSGQCPTVCRCKWVSGKKTAECTQSDLTVVPMGLSSELQSLDLSQNRLTLLPANAFRTVGLVNLHKLFLRECRIRELSEDAFSGLSILIELDLSGNEIHTLHPMTFRPMGRLRLIYLNRNPLTSLPDGLFSDMSFLQTVEVSDCQLKHVGHRAFQNVSALAHLKLDGNHLVHLQLSAVEHLEKLKGLVLENNPWRCDCHLRPLRDWTIRNKLYTKPTQCAEPHKLRNKLWSELEADDFACKPQIMAPPPGSVVEADSDEVMLSCKVNGNPSPEVYWVHNTRVIGNTSLSVYGDQRFRVTDARAGGEMVRWVNLTIHGVRPQDRGLFICVAKSNGGVEERNVTLSVRASGLGGLGGVLGPGGSVADAWPLIAGLVAGVVLLLFAVVLLCCCLVRRRRVLRQAQNSKKPPPEGRSPNGDIITHHVRADGSDSSEQQKSLLTMVNPVQKPPRRYDHPSSQGTELSELNRNLLDDGSVYGHADDEGRSLDSLAGTSTPQRSGSDADPGPTERCGSAAEQRPPVHNSYPPDLLAFPSRSASVTGGPHSPASTASTALCGTLPYSRSQSPFSPPLSQPLVQPRSGYVTIPRRPRVPSWSSPTPTPCLDDPLLLLKLEPVYDNMGPRTTADGSSVLSLNKAGVEPSPARTARPAAFLPSPLPAYYAPIEEQDPIPSPAPVRANGHTRSTPSPGDKSKRGSWSRIAPESGTLNRPPSSRSEEESLYTPGTTKRPSSIASVTSANSTTPLTNGQTGVRTIKVPPKPPPKPKKKVGPLFEDEGEDGTEV